MSDVALRSHDRAVKNRLIGSYRVLPREYYIRQLQDAFISPHDNLSSSSATSHLGGGRDEFTSQPFHHLCGRFSALILFNSHIDYQ